LMETNLAMTLIPSDGCLFRWRLTLAEQESCRNRNRQAKGFTV
jgi:hypothetical protein